MTKPRLLIENAIFLDEEKGQYIAGKLIQFDLCLIFKSLPTTMWVDGHETPMPEDSLAIKCSEYFEDEHLIVCPLFACQFNAPANAYLNEKLNKEGVPLQLIAPNGGFVQ